MEMKFTLHKIQLPKWKKWRK